MKTPVALWWLVGIMLTAILLTTVIATVIDSRLKLGGWRAGASRRADLIRWTSAAYAGIGVVVLTIYSTRWLDEVFWPASVVLVGHALLFSHWYYEIPAVISSQVSLERRPDLPEWLDDGQA